MIIILDPGHGINTPGKRSPDNRLLEYKYCREIVNEIKRKLTNLGYAVQLTVNSDKDVSLSTRCKTVNKYCSMYGSKNVLLVSVHCNAAGSNNQWHNARGWLAFVSHNASNNSKLLAKCLAEEAYSRGLKGNRYVPEEKYLVKSLAMCRDTNCPAVLTENLFQDNKEDVDLLLSEEGRKLIVDTHVNGIIKYVKEIE